MIFEWKGTCFAFSSGRKIPILHTTNGTFLLLEILVRPRLECHLCFQCLVMVGAWATPQKFQQDSEECFWAWVHQLNKLYPFGLWISSLSMITFRKTMKILEDSEGNVPAHKYMKVKQPRKERDYCSWRVWNFNQRSEKTLYPQDELNFIRGLLWPAWTHTASRHFRISSILVCLMIFQKL